MEYTERHYRSACGRLDLFARDYRAAAQDAPPILLMHGLTRNSADFEPLAAHLAGRYRLIVPDQRGRGRSQYDPEPANYRPDVYAQDMLTLLDDLGLEQTALIGTSMGGLMAMILAAAAPQRVGPVVLNDVGPEIEAAGLARIAAYVGSNQPLADWDAAADACAAINGEAFPDFGPADWQAFARRTFRILPDGRVAAAYDPAIAGVSVVVPTGQPDLWPLWEMMGTRPVLLLRGALTDILAAATAERMQSSHQGPFVWQDVPGRGHAPLLDEPECLTAIDLFLAKQWPA
jgi:pimeloyl-ACP methyl ester carboxylesterase